MQNIFTIANCNEFYAICGSHEHKFLDAFLYKSIYYANMPKFIKKLVQENIHLHCDEFAEIIIGLFDKSQRFYGLLIEKDAKITMDANDFFVFCVLHHRGCITSAVAKEYLWRKYGFEKILQLHDTLGLLLDGLFDKLSHGASMRLIDTRVAYSIQYFLISPTRMAEFGICLSISYASPRIVKYYCVQDALQHIRDYPFPLISIMDDINNEFAQNDIMRLLADEYVIHAIFGKLANNGLRKMNSKLIQHVRRLCS